MQCKPLYNQYIDLLNPLQGHLKNPGNKDLEILRIIGETLIATTENKPKPIVNPPIPPKKPDN